MALKNIPIYNAEILDAECGIDRISLVNDPAVDAYFVSFSKDKIQQMFTTNEEQKMITGVVMRCDYPIYRNDEHLGEYYINFSADVIKQMAQKLLRDNNQNNVNIEHMFNSDVEGVEMVELFIKDRNKGKNPTGFEDINDGSLFATFKVDNQDIWQQIKNGTFKGYSLEGLFNYVIPDNNTDEVVEDEEKLIDDIETLIEQIREKINNL
jgi:hypothetical protein